MCDFKRISSMGYSLLLGNSIGETKDCAKPTLLSVPAHVQKASLGENFSALLTTEGDIYTFGYGGSIVNGMGMLGHGSMDSFKAPKLVESLIEDGCYASDVHVGEYSMTVLTTEGEVLTCGSGSYGRLGNVETTDQLYLEPVELMGAEETVQIAGGHAFSLALNIGGIIHSWGRNNEGQLGVGMGMAVDAYSMESIPQPIEGDLEGRKVSRIAAGHSHAAAVTVDGELFTWGMNSSHEPKLESSLLHTKIVDVACGKNYTLALDEEGRVHAMGNGKTGVLGLASTKYSAFPILVEGIPAEERVVQMSCGHAHVACVTELKK
jgi:alpha-tubulin suppressor-like RCC1 family protein